MTARGKTKGPLKTEKIVEKDSAQSYKQFPGLIYASLDKLVCLVLTKISHLFNGGSPNIFL
jgi:hypothetical protein